MKVELHAHTSEVSPCGKVPAAQQVRYYADAGYSTLVITDHLFGKLNPEEPLDVRAEKYLTGYRVARKVGKELGVHVLLGAEVRFPTRPEDILVFGLREEDIPWLMSLMDADGSHEALHEALNSRGLLEIQAHPFRRGLRPIPQRYLDGVEVYNAHPRHDSHNGLAMFYAEQGGPRFIRTSGSDAHQPQDAARGGILSPEPICDNRALLALLRGPRDLARICTP